MKCLKEREEEHPDALGIEAVFISAPGLTGALAFEGRTIGW